MRKKKQIQNANYLQEILKDISFTQQIFIHVHDVTLTDLDARKTAIRWTKKSPTLTKFTFSSRKTGNKQVKINK